MGFLVGSVDSIVCVCMQILECICRDGGDVVLEQRRREIG